MPQGAGTTISLLLCLTLCGCDLFVCQSPSDGPLPAGAWGGDGWSLTAQPDGTAFVEGSCARGAVNEPILIEDGAFSFTVLLTPQNVAPAVQPYETAFSGTICGDVMSGEVAANGSGGLFELSLGEPPLLERCEATSAPLPHRIAR